MTDLPPTQRDGHGDDWEVPILDLPELSVTLERVPSLVIHLDLHAQTGRELPQLPRLIGGYSLIGNRLTEPSPHALAGNVAVELPRQLLRKSESACELSQGSAFLRTHAVISHHLAHGLVKSRMNKSHLKRLHIIEPEIQYPCQPL